MSWNSYIGSVMGHCKGNCDKVSIIGLDASTWTTDEDSSNFHIEPAEAGPIAAAMKNGDFSTLQANGIRIGGLKYTFIREVDGKVVLGKLKEHGAVTLQKSKQAVIVAHCKEGGSQGDVNEGVNNIASYLESIGY